MNNPCVPTNSEIELARADDVKVDEKSKRGPGLLSYLAVGVPLAFGIFFLFSAPLYTIITFAMAASVFYAVRKSFLDDVAKSHICHEKGWTYDPTPRYEKGLQLSAIWGGNFAQGRDIYVEDQIWGDGFYAGDHSRRVGSGKSSHTVRVSFVGVPAKLNVSFNLTKQYLELFTTKQELQLESERFNEMFEFSYEGTKENMALPITQILTPAMQVALVDLGTAFPGLAICFREDSIFFIFGKSLYRPRFVNVWRLRTDEKDI